MSRIPDNPACVLSKRRKVQIRNKETDVEVVEWRVAAITRTLCVCSNRRAKSPWGERPIVEGMIKAGKKMARVRQGIDVEERNIERGKEKWNEMLAKVKGRLQR